MGYFREGWGLPAGQRGEDDRPKVSEAQRIVSPSHDSGMQETERKSLSGGSGRF